MRAVDIQSMGLCSPLGFNWEQFFQGILDCSRSPGTARSNDAFLCGKLDPRAILGKRNYRPFDRVCQLGLIALHSTLRDGMAAEDEPVLPPGTGLAIGTMFSGLSTIMSFDYMSQVEGVQYASPLDFGNTVINAAAGQSAIFYGLKGPNYTFAGQSGSATCIAETCRKIQLWEDIAYLAGGIEEQSEESANAFRRAGLLASTDAPSVPGNSRSDGLVLGEGAAFFKLSAAGQGGAGTQSHGRILGVGTAYRPLTSPGLVSGIESAIQSAGEGTGIAPSDLATVSLSLRGLPSFDRTLLDAALRCFPSPTTRFFSAQRWTGELLGAGFAFSLLVMLAASRRGLLPSMGSATEFTSMCDPSRLIVDEQLFSPQPFLVLDVSLDGYIVAAMVQPAIDG